MVLDGWRTSTLRVVEDVPETSALHDGVISSSGHRLKRSQVHGERKERETVSGSESSVGFTREGAAAQIVRACNV